MEFPFEIEEYEPPTLSDVKRWLRASCSWRGLLGLAIGAFLAFGGLRLQQHFTSPQTTGTGTIAISTTPAGAFLSIDGRELGQSPATISLPGDAAMSTPTAAAISPAPRTPHRTGREGVG
jgi:hypothetical protein